MRSVLNRYFCITNTARSEAPGQMCILISFEYTLKKWNHWLIAHQRPFALFFCDLVSFRWKRHFHPLNIVGVVRVNCPSHKTARHIQVSSIVGKFASIFCPPYPNKAACLVSRIQEHCRAMFLQKAPTNIKSVVPV